MTAPTRRSLPAIGAPPGALLPRAISLFVLGVAAIAWLLCIVPTGLGVRDLATFAGPGAALWISLGAAAHVVRRRNVSWRSLVRWMLLGGLLLPPVLGFLVAVAGLDRPTELLTLFTIGPWFVLIIGALLGMLMELDLEDRGRLTFRGGTHEDRHPTAPGHRRGARVGSADQGEGDRHRREGWRGHAHRNGGDVS